MTAWCRRAMTMVVVAGTAAFGTLRPPIVHAAGPVSVTRVASPEKALRFEVTVAGSLDEVWAAFTTSEGLGAWLWHHCRSGRAPAARSPSLKKLPSGA